MKPFSIALCQNIPGYDVERNIDKAFTMIGKAADRGAKLVSLPEMFYHPFELKKLPALAAYEAELRDRFSTAAKKHAIYLCTGSFVTQTDDNRVANSSAVFGPDGANLCEYSKCHLFDVSFGTLQLKESSVFSKGDGFCMADTDLGKIGILICYDIRFPEAAREVALMGAELLIVPAVFNQITGPAHWHLFMRCRAVENQLFVATVSQGKNNDSGYKAYGHSMVVSPWGDVLAEASDDERIVMTEIDPAVLEKTRKQLPLLNHRREDLY
ncbi:carbon-nitrogen hydrolase family protein [Chitinispirillales bacterium ANBcel5]|uniref:carbon-nitrogen hydrolase family protein n=1 Tax=Cellulosispirillum alkaliphilum TaxID=3039283 RepID=UPI002A5144FB|nr:carbon-nitrogen hydrolase family protein [Chitinispirillales bacterium ANBcel5]